MNTRDLGIYLEDAHISETTRSWLPLTPPHPHCSFLVFRPGVAFLPLELQRVAQPQAQSTSFRTRADTICPQGISFTSPTSNKDESPEWGTRFSLNYHSCVLTPNVCNLLNKPVLFEVTWGSLFCGAVGSASQGSPWGLEHVLHPVAAFNRALVYRLSVGVTAIMVTGIWSHCRDIKYMF